MAGLPLLLDNSSSQAHFGGGLECLAYDPNADESLYLFGSSARIEAKSKLLNIYLE